MSNDPVNRPAHYTSGRYEAIEVIEDAVYAAPDAVTAGCHWQALKYLLRLWFKGEPLQDARKAILMFRQVNVAVLGIIENMSYFQCPSCRTRTDIFGHGGGAETAARYGIPFLGEIPLNASVREGGDAGKPIVIADPESEAARTFWKIAGAVAARVSAANAGVPYTGTV